MFTSYYRHADGDYREVFGLGLEHLQPGTRFAHRPGVTLSQQDNVDEALDTINAAMVHYDGSYADKTAFGRPLMVSTITVQRLIGMASKTFGLARRRIRSMHEVSLLKPVFGGDTLYAESEVLAVEPLPAGCGLVRLRTRGINQRGEEVAGLDYSFEMMSLARVPLLAGMDARPAIEPRFASHRQRADGAWLEQTGLFFEDLEPGETFHHYPGRTFRTDESVTHALRSLEIAPAYHEGTKPQATEPWLLAVTAALTTRTFGRVTANLAWRNVEFASADVAGLTLRARSRIVSKRESVSRPSEGIVTVSTEATGDAGQPILSFERTLLVYRRDAHTPYEAAGY
jgi:itaconyl-CoA hydratase